MPDKLILTRAEIAAWLGISTDQVKRLPLPTVPVASRGDGRRTHSRIPREAVIRYLAASGAADAPAFPSQKRSRCRP